MTMKTTIYLALRNLTRQKRRSAMLAAAIAFGFFVVTAIDGLATGAVNCLEEQITQLNGGNVFVQGVEHEIGPDGAVSKKLNSIIRDPEYIAKVLEKSGISYEYYAQRTGCDGTILFNNKKIAANLYGCDFSAENHLLNSLVVEEGELSNVSAPDALVITRKNADVLNVKIGDKVLISTTTVNGQRNVGEFTVALITKEVSLMGSLMVYAPIATVNSLIELPEGGYNNFTVYMKDKRRQNEAAQKIEDIIRADGNNVSDRAEAYRKAPNNPSGQLRKQLTNNLVPGVMYTAFSLNDAVPQIQQVTAIVHSITTVILLVILLIVMVGIANTYRMILMERIKEIGTMRALGMTGRNSGRMFTAEAVILSLIGACAGFILALLAMTAATLPEIHNDIISFFLSKGHLTFIMSAGSVISKYLIMILLTVLAVRGTAKGAARLQPAEALRSTK